MLFSNEPTHHHKLNSTVNNNNTFSKGAEVYWRLIEYAICPFFLIPLERDLLVSSIQVWSSPGVPKSWMTAIKKGAGVSLQLWEPGSALGILLLHYKPIISTRVDNSSKSLDWTAVGQTVKLTKEASINWSDSQLEQIGRELARLTVVNSQA